MPGARGSLLENDYATSAVQGGRAGLAARAYVLGGQPMRLVQRVEGLVAALNYLDGMRPH